MSADDETTGRHPAVLRAQNDALLQENDRLRRKVRHLEDLVNRLVDGETP